jgi:phosphonopyruvate decarboxylase
MLSCEDFYNLCAKFDLTFFSGVPDSTFKSWMSFLYKNHGKRLTNITTVNECEAVAVCTGYHLSTGKIGVLYMQNSGLGKTVNPLTSLCDQNVYSIPMLLMIGLRGEPGVKDAHQHHRMGPITTRLLDLLGIPYEIITSDVRHLENTLKKAKDYMEKNKSSFALIVRRNIFEKKDDDGVSDLKYPLREEAIKTILSVFDGNEVIISTTGKTSRELYENRIDKDNRSHDFYNVGAMGCAQSIALGIALEKKNKEIFVFDGDGSVLMQMGALATIGHQCPENYYHIIFDNQSHDSTGGQPTCSDSVDFEKVALACGYKKSYLVDNTDLLAESIIKMKKEKGPVLIVVKIKKGSRSDLGRPILPPKLHKEKFMDYLKGK